MKMKLSKLFFSVALILFCLSLFCLISWIITAETNFLASTMISSFIGLAFLMLNLLEEVKQK